MKVDPSDTYHIIILLILLALSAFFSSNETALMSVNKIRLRSLADEGNKRAAMALDILENQTPKLLSAILIGNNIVNISASSLATTLAYSFGGYMVSIVTVILTDRVDLDIMDMQDRIRMAFPYLLEIRREVLRKADYSEQLMAEKEQDPFELCCSFLKDLDDEEKTILRDVIHTVQGVK